VPFETMLVNVSVTLFASRTKLQTELWPM